MIVFLFQWQAYAATVKSDIEARYILNDSHEHKATVSFQADYVDYYYIYDKFIAEIKLSVEAIPLPAMSNAVP